MTVDLIEWLRAQLDEDERAVSVSTLAEMFFGDPGGQDGRARWVMPQSALDELTAFFRRFDPDAFASPSWLLTEGAPPPLTVEPRLFGLPIRIDDAAEAIALERL